MRSLLEKHVREQQIFREQMLENRSGFALALCHHQRMPTTWKRQSWKNSGGFPLEGMGDELKTTAGRFILPAVRQFSVQIC